MRGKCCLLRRPSATGLILALAALSLAGCSAIGPESSWTESEGTIEGTVLTTSGKEISDISVRLWGGLDADATPIEYRVTTNPGGVYAVTSVELGYAHAYEKAYQIYVNRSVLSAAPINSAYGTYVGTVTVSANGTWLDVTITEAPPGPPDNYFE